MRQIVNISLPLPLMKEVERGVKDLHCSSKSEFFRHLVREWLVMGKLEKSRKEFQEGKGKKMSTLKDLWS